MSIYDPRRLKKYRERIAELEEALRPFSAMFREGQDDDEDIGHGPGMVVYRGVASDMTAIWQKDFRHAREIL